MACQIGICECSSNETTKFGNVTHVDASHSRVEGQSPASGSVGLFLRTKNADKVLIVERRDNERVIRKSGFSHYSINFSLTSKVGDIKLAFANCFDVRQRGPDKMLDAGIFRGAYGGACLLQFVRTVLLEVGHQKYA